MNRQLAEVEQALAENRWQGEDIKIDQSKDFADAKADTEEYKTNKLFEDLQKIQNDSKASEADKKKAIEAEIKLREALKQKLEEEAKALDMQEDFGAAERKRLEATKMQDAIDSLKNVPQQQQQMTMAQSPGGLAAGLMGIQYDTPQQEQVKILTDINKVVGDAAMAAKAAADAASKPIVINRFL